MDITSVNKPNKLSHFRSAQFHYATIYIAVTFLALLFLNIYSAKISQEQFFNSKKTSMIEKCYLAANTIAELDVLNTDTVAKAVSGFEDMHVSRLIITNDAGTAIYDSNSIHSSVNTYVLYPEIVSALSANDVFYWKYQNGAMLSNAAVPVYSYGSLIGCVYMTEFDTAQGTLIAALQNSIFVITLILEIIVVLFSIFFSHTYSRRLRKIMASIRILREGDYSHKLSIRGHDELNSLSNEFNDLISRLQTSENKRSQFVSDASHELKTPLASIKLLSDSILQNTMDVDTIKEFVGDIGKEADRLNRMSQKLLSLSRTETQPESTTEITYIAPTIERVIRMLSENANHNHTEIIFDCQADFPILILEDDLSQVVFNLVENGIKYNRRGGLLKISLSRDGENVVLQVADSGIGIPDEALNHIFERFYRVDKARSRSTGGSGLGLSIVRNMVERNHGTIAVESTVGVGTVFTIHFPIFDTKEEQQ